MKTLAIDSLDDLPDAAEAVIDALAGRTVVAFRGEMGAGKTTLIGAILDRLGSADTVTSPTFALAHEYTHGNISLYHFDMYRVSGFDELYSTGFFDYLEQDGVLYIEWSENIESVLPPNTITVEISRPQEGDDPDLRRILIRRP